MAYRKKDPLPTHYHNYEIVDVWDISPEREVLPCYCDGLCSCNHRDWEVFHDRVKIRRRCSGCGHTYTTEEYGSASDYERC